MIPTTEQLLCSPLGFDLAKATPVQRARCRIGDGLPLGELAADPAVVQMVGGREALAALPSERGVTPATVVDLSSIRSAKTLMAVCRATRAIFSVNVDGLRIGEVPRVALYSLKLSRGKVAFRMLRALFQRPALAPLVLSETAESLLVRHSSGCPIEIVCVAGGRSAQDFVGDWLAGVIADEAPRMLGRDDGVVNLSDVLTAVQGRVLAGGQVQLIGSPWAPNGPVYDLTQEHFGKPSDAIVVLRSTGPQNNPEHFTPERCAQMERSDPVAFSTSVLAEFADPEAGLLSVVAVRRSTREEPLELPPEPDTRYGAHVDVGRGRWTLAIVACEDEEEDDRDEDGPMRRYRVALAREVLSSDPDTAWAEIARLCRRYGVTTVTVDQYAGAESGAIARRYGLTCRQRDWTPASRLEAFENLATLIAAGRVELSPDRTLRRDLLSVKKRAKQTGGFDIRLPHTSDHRHADFAPALAAAVRDAGNVLRDGDLEVFGVISERSSGWGVVRGVGVRSRSSDDHDVWGSLAEKRRKFLRDELPKRRFR